MQDRISKFPGRVKLIPVDGQENVFDLVRADEPEVEGTPLNKGTLLTDDTANVYGLDDTATPNDVFYMLPDYIKERENVHVEFLESLTANKTLTNNRTLTVGTFATTVDKFKEYMGVIVEFLGSINFTNTASSNSSEASLKVGGLNLISTSVSSSSPVDITFLSEPAKWFYAYTGLSAGGAPVALSARSNYSYPVSSGAFTSAMAITLNDTRDGSYAQLGTFKVNGTFTLYGVRYNVK